MLILVCDINKTHKYSIIYLGEILMLKETMKIYVFKK
jgi:hypothetical protein